MKSGESSSSVLEKAAWAGRALENFLLSIVLSGMILLASAQIIMRNFAGGGIAWADEALRLMLLWLAMLGAVAASRENRHIAIDVLSRVLPPALKTGVSVGIHTFTAVVAGLLAWYAWVFLGESFEYQDKLLGNMPAWWFQSILPVAFALMAYRYIVHALSSLRALFSGEAES
ncbi:MAG: TRAP transporter small permease [Gammaproteobacteria bacterium]